MENTRKLCAGLLAAAGLGWTATIAAQTSSEAVLPASDAAELVTMEISGPVLVFTGQDWYTLADGQWYGLASDGEWYLAAPAADEDADASSYGTSSTDGESALYAAEDGTLYSFDDGTWYIWVPVEASVVSSADAGASAELAYGPDASVSYVVQLDAPDGRALYSFSDGQWQSVADVGSEASPGYIVYVR